MPKLIVIAKLSSSLIFLLYISNKVATKHAITIEYPKGSKLSRNMLVIRALEKKARLPSNDLFSYIFIEPKALPKRAAAVSEISIIDMDIIAMFLVKKITENRDANKTKTEPLNLIWFLLSSKFRHSFEKMKPKYFLTGGNFL